jgi:hypothetical protein
VKLLLNANIAIAVSAMLAACLIEFSLSAQVDTITGRPLPKRRPSTSGHLRGKATNDSRQPP